MGFKHARQSFKVEIVLQVVCQSFILNGESEFYLSGHHFLSHRLDPNDLGIVRRYLVTFATGTSGSDVKQKAETGARAVEKYGDHHAFKIPPSWSEGVNRSLKTTLHKKVTSAISNTFMSFCTHVNCLLFLTQRSK